MDNKADFRKAVLGTIYFIVFTVILSVVVMYPYFSRYMMGEMFFQDAPIRKEMAGSLDFLVVGASQGCRAFDTSVLDEHLDVNSYNLAVPMMTMDARDYMMKKEIERNEVSAVVIEISYNVLARDRESEGPEGILTTLGNLDNIAERWEFFTSNVLFKEYGQVYYQMLDYGIRSWANIFSGNVPVYSVGSSKKGYSGLEASDMTLTQEEFRERYQLAQSSARIEYNDESCMTLEGMISYCQSRGIRVILCVVPVSEGDLARHNMDSKNALNEYLEKLADEYGCEAYDFNLLKNRAELFPEATAFYDESHLSAAGADSFTRMFCKVVTDADPESYFWKSYDEAEQESVYVEYFRSADI